MSVPGVVRMACEYCKCPVELLGHHQAGELVGQRHASERKRGLCKFWRLVRPATRRANGEDNRLLA